MNKSWFTGLGDLAPYDSPLPEDLQIRQSQVQSMMLCPMKEGLKRSPGFTWVSSEPMIFGSVMHEVFDIHFNAWREVDLSDADLVEALFYKVAERDGFDLLDYATKHKVQVSAIEITQAYDLWQKQWWPQFKGAFKPLTIEEKLIRPLGRLDNGRYVWMFGTPDIGLQAGMVDWKTSGRAWTQGKANTLIQAPVYLWLLEEKRNQIEGIAKYVVYNRAKMKWSEFIVPISKVQIDAMLVTVWEFAKMMDAGIYPATPYSPAGAPGRGWWCTPKFCNVWNYCEAKGLPSDGVLVHIKRDPKW